MAKPPSSFSLQMLNLWIGLCEALPGLPASLRDLGYCDLAIESPISNADWGEVVPELIVASKETGHCLLLEWKSGANLADDQLRRYSLVAPDDAIQTGFIPQDACRTLDVVIIARSEHEQRIRQGLAAASCDFPLLLVEEDAIRLACGRFADKALSKTFSPRLMVDFSACPSSYVPFDQESDTWEVAEAVMPAVIERMIQGESRILLEELATAVLRTWSMMGPRHQKALRKRIFEAVDKAASERFSSYFRRNTKVERQTKTKTWEVYEGVIPPEPIKRTRVLKRLRALLAAFLADLREGKDKERQLTLL
jgi:hypothetical protein